MERTFKLSLPFIVISVLLALTGCEEKKDPAASLPVENTIELVAVETPEPIEKPITPKCVTPKPVKKENTEETPPTEEATQKPTIEPTVPAKTFTLQGLKNREYNLTLQDNKVSLENNTKPLLLIHLFDPSTASAVAQAPYLSKLQKKYSEKLTILAIPSSDTLGKEELRSWLETHNATYFISTSQENPALLDRLTKTLNITTSPSTLLYHNGVNHSYYEGAVPIEMITHDILQISKK